MVPAKPQLLIPQDFQFNREARLAYRLFKAPDSPVKDLPFQNRGTLIAHFRDIDERNFENPITAQEVENALKKQNVEISTQEINAFCREVTLLEPK